MTFLNQKKFSRFFSFCLGLLFLFSCPAIATDWSLEDPSKGWNSRELIVRYFHNSELQTQWAWEALSRYSFKGNEHVLDYGAGDGKLSALMSFMVPKGSVWGIDISTEMMHFALKMFPSGYYKNLNFLPTSNIDLGGIPFPTKFDIVTSFCVFHLVPNPKSVLESMKLHMHPGAKLIATFPIGGNLEFFQAASEEMAKRGWSFPSPTEGTKAMRDPNRARQIFTDAGFSLDYFQVIDTRNSFSTKEEMIDWFEGTLSANWDIPTVGRREFFSDLADRYLVYRPQDKDNDGFVYFSLKRIDLTATPIFENR